MLIGRLPVKSTFNGNAVKGFDHNLRSPTRQAARQAAMGKAKQVLLFDVMDTICRDPFYKVMPAYFGMTLKELIAVKHPTAWVQFEKGEINQDDLFRDFFKDGRSFDHQGFLQTVVNAYGFLDGMEELLGQLHAAGCEMHIMSNYTAWWRLIEQKLQLSRFAQWTFLSCEGPMKGIRKPDAQCFSIAADVLGVEPQQMVLIDDRAANVDAAQAAGLQGTAFESAEQLSGSLRASGLQF